MKKVIYLLLSLIVLTAVSSCNKQKTVQEILREQQKAIDLLIDRNDFVILKEYPKNGIFKEKEFYLTSDGLYIHVSDTGNGRKVTPMKDVVTVRFNYCFIVQDYIDGTDTLLYRPSYLEMPFEFRYGITGSYTRMACNGWAYPLEYVTEGAIVDLIIPSKLGSSSDESAYYARFFKDLQYTSFY